MNDIALYIHWPFCLQKCPYCDFNSHVRNSIDQSAWRDALLQEIARAAQNTPNRTLRSIFFGGGTPSLMPPETVAALIDAAGRFWRFANDIEITLEANPTSVEQENFKALALAGVGRISLGVQSLDDETLRWLGRTHSASQAKKALEIAAENFSRTNFDLIYALKGQSVAQWEQLLLAALPLARGHMSLYQLTIEPNTGFALRAAQGEILTATEDEAAEMFQLTQEIMAHHNLPAYEISNHAEAGAESRHNLVYWHYGDFLGVGAGAHGRYVRGDGRRVATVALKQPEQWLRAVQHNHQIEEINLVDDAEAQQEALMMGLRLHEGIEKERWYRKFNAELSSVLPQAKAAKLRQEELLIEDDEAVKLTAQGRMRLNAVLRYLFADA